jgi:hypothetical protein
MVEVHGHHVPPPVESSLPNVVRLWSYIEKMISRLDSTCFNGISPPIIIPPSQFVQACCPIGMYDRFFQCMCNLDKSIDYHEVGGKIHGSE